MSLAENQEQLLNALNNLEDDLGQLVHEIKNQADQEFIWLFVLKEIRYDELENLPLAYFKNQNPKKFKLGYLHYLSAFKRSLTILFKMVYSSLKSKNATINLEKKVLFFVGSSSKKHRYGSIINHYSEREKSFSSHSFYKDVDVQGNESFINFACFIKWTDFHHSFKRAYRLIQLLRNIKRDSLVKKWVKSFSILDFWVMLLKHQALKNAFDECPPRGIYFSAGPCYPPLRMVGKIAKEHQIPMTLVAPRPMITKLRAEDRVAEIDLALVDKFPIADFFIVRDQWSFDQLLQFKISRNKIYLLDQSKSNNFSVTLEYINAIVLLLTSKKNVNDQFIKAIDECIVEERPLLYREHPALQLTEQQRTILSDKGWVSITQYSIGELSFKDSIALCINSTAGIEFINRGCSLFWLPYLNFRSPMFYEIMLKIGEVIENTFQLAECLKLDTKSVRAIQAKHQKQYDHYLTKKTNTPVFIPQLYA